MNRKYIYPLVIIFVTVLLFYAENYFENQPAPVSDNALKSQKNSEVFDDALLPVSTTGAIVKHTYFTLSYSEEHEQSEWVAYELKKSELSKNEFDRPFFVEDEKVKSKSADWRNYKNSGYDRGHLCPAGDRRFSFEAYNETFLTSNISPQDHDFNAGIWNRLEQKVRYWAEKKNGVYVITGGVLTGKMKTIGEEKVSVPNAFYKIVVATSEGTFNAIAVLIPNRASSDSFYEYAVSIDEVEARTGIDFFPKLPDSVETQLEATIDVKAWGRR